MDTGQLIFIASRLFFSAVAALFAVILWSRTRDAAWMLIVLGTIGGYIETVYTIMGMFGISTDDFFSVGSMSIVTIILSNLPEAFFISAFCVFIARKYKAR
jgi:hypothetical protein